MWRRRSLSVNTVELAVRHAGETALAILTPEGSQLIARGGFHPWGDGARKSDLRPVGAGPGFDPRFPGAECPWLWT